MTAAGLADLPVLAAVADLGRGKPGPVVSHRAGG